MFREQYWGLEINNYQYKYFQSVKKTIIILHGFLFNFEIAVQKYFCREVQKYSPHIDGADSSFKFWALPRKRDLLIVFWLVFKINNCMQEFPVPCSNYLKKINLIVYSFPSDSTCIC